MLGRWDVRFALDSSLLPKLQDPFDPLPRCSPGTLVGTDGLPATPDNIVSEAWLRARPNVITLPDTAVLLANQQPLTTDDYPLRIEWDGIVPDDEIHPNDIVRRVRDVLTLLWGERAGDIEREACEILGIASLREYFRQPKYFFDFHIKRYSKSRRKAPLYWLLQTKSRRYGLWLYYHRLTTDTLYRAAREYVDPKITLEENRLQELQMGAKEMQGAARKNRERDITAQTDFLAELKAFRKTLDRVALLNLPFDRNDGVILNIAPLHELTPWKEAGKMWNELVSGKYEWSTVSRHLRKLNLVKG